MSDCSIPGGILCVNFLEDGFISSCSCPQYFIRCWFVSPALFYALTYFMAEYMDSQQYVVHKVRKSH